MKFIIYKTSQSYNYDVEKMPIKGCKKEYDKNDGWYYTKEINSIEELLELSDIAGEIVVTRKDVIYGKPRIEIYDTYRE